MSDRLTFAELQIRRAPGFERDGFTLAGLSPGINLIHGPNGVGKSTTARAVGGLLWPGVVGGGRASLWGSFRLSGAEWSVDVDGSRVQYRRDGAQAAAPPLPPGEGHQRYLLSLHDLLRERDAGFAAAMAREMAGGFDVRRSGAVLDPGAVLSRRGPLNEALENAQAEYELALARQQELLEQERGLAELRAGYAEADKAQRRVAVLQAALDHAHARDREAEARTELGRYAAAMERVSGDEYDRLCRIRDSLRKLDAARRETERKAEEARDRGAALILPDEAMREELLTSLRADLAELEAAERELERARLAHDRARARRQADASRLDGVVDLDRLADADLSDVAGMVAFAQRASRVSTQRHAVESRLRTLTGEDGGAEADRLRGAIHQLRHWLREPDFSAAKAGGGDAWRRPAGIAALLGVLVLAVLLAAAGQPVLAGVAAVAAVLLAVALWPDGSSAARVDAREVYRRAYEKSGFDQPSRWDAETVAALLTRLEESLGSASYREAQQRARGELEQELDAIAEEERQIETERARIAAHLGVTPSTVGAAELTWVSETLVRWQAAHTEALAEKAALQSAQLRLEELAAGLRARLEPLGYPSLATIGQVSSSIAALGDRRQALREAQREERDAEARLRQIAEDRALQEREIESIFVALGLGAESDDTVRVWCEARGEYRDAYERHRNAAGGLAKMHDRLTALGAADSLAALPAPELQLMLDAEKERAIPRDGLQRQIASIEALVDAAKRSHDVEAAFERRERARQELRDARERDFRSVIASELIDALERATRDQHLPAVFRRAREIFSRITHGRYELRLDLQDEPQFTAFDEIDRQERRLEELSSGTRVQLLLAVRVAFVERQEQGVRLPLLLDEVLGNSDDERAFAIMDAAVELAREGRQIFYFTAQVDEVARWRAMVAGGGAGSVDLKEIDLRELRRLERHLEIPRIIPAPRLVPPAPDGLDHAAYGSRLGIARLDRAEVDAADLHVWFLTDDPQTLHRLITLGPERWGALRALLRDGGRPLIEEPLLSELETAGRVAEEFLEAARVGVGRRVDRAVLENSGAVTAVFIDRVTDLAAQLEGDGARLMEALERGAVSHFKQKNKESLRDYLEAGGYLTQEPPLELAEIRDRVLRRVAAEVGTAALSIDRLDRLVGRLWVGLGGGEGVDPVGDAAPTATASPQNR